MWEGESPATFLDQAPEMCPHPLPIAPGSTMLEPPLEEVTAMFTPSCPILLPLPTWPLPERFLHASLAGESSS